MVGVEADAEPRTAASPQEWTSQERSAAWLFSLTLLLSSFLLFSVQPLVARQLLPLVGGSSALWTTAMLFFQTMLLVGYAAAHLSTRWLGRRQPWLHLALILVPLLVLPFAVPDGWVLPVDTQPAIWVLGVMVVMVSLPFFALSTMSPTLQQWFAESGHPRAQDPYFLYAAGNVGSVVALLAYPVLFERVLGVEQQARWWAWGYAGLVLCSAVAAFFTLRAAPVRPEPAVGVAAPAAHAEDDVELSWSRRGRWLLLSAIPSLLLLAITAHITTDLASFPLLWVVPLLLYLITHIVAFAKDSARRDKIMGTIVWLGALPMAFASVVQSRLGAWTLLVPLIWFFAAAMYCHSRLALDRPPANKLTEFYLWLAGGGALGGLFASIVAPLAFEGVYEYPLGIAAALAVVRRPSWDRFDPEFRKVCRLGVILAVIVALFGPTSFVFAAALVAIVLAFFAFGPVGAIIGLVSVLAGGAALLGQSGEQFRDRSFFGVTMVVDDDVARKLRSGTTIHGTQMSAQGDTPRPTTYYYQEGPVGQVFGAYPSRDVGVIGLGTGAIAWYGKPGDRYEMFEIDPVVRDLATNPQYFNYLSSAEAETVITLGDGRQSLLRSTTTFDIIVVDAFSSDSIPTHLLTEEAVELYFDRLSDDGVLLMHISNRHFDLGPILGRIGAELGVDARIQRYSPDNNAAIDEGATSSIWVTLTRNPGPLGDGFEPLGADGPLWTDDHADPLSALDLFKGTS